ncbi:MAG: hypothetical protein LBD41_05340 [Clostridiales Family XIII bacterium]|jgi:hypothetical protein|nr:hypothetical protein [Clostridiales Family XIII bacterium]
MKAIILKKEKGKTILLDEEGNFRSTVFHGKKSIGSQVYYDCHLSKKIASFVVCFVLVISLGMSTIFFTSNKDKVLEKPFYSIYIDVNPSVVVDVDENDKVIEARALNNDGKDIVKAIEKATPRDKAIKKIFYAVKDKGFDIEKNSKTKLPKAYFTIAGSDKQICQKKLRKIEQTTENLAVKTFIANIDDAVKAEAKKVSIAKIFVTKKISEKIKDLSEEELLTMPVSTLSEYEAKVTDSKDKVSEPVECTFVSKENKVKKNCKTKAKKKTTKKEKMVNNNSGKKGNGSTSASIKDTKKQENATRSSVSKGESGVFTSAESVEEVKEIEENETNLIIPE